MKRIIIILSVVLIGFFFACEEVNDLIYQAPELETGVVLSGEIVAPHDTVTASIKANNPEEGPLFYEWNCSGGLFVKPADTDTVLWIAPVEGGSYSIWVKVSNQRRSTTSKEKNVEVVTPEEPFVEILSPANGSYYVIGQMINIEAYADHPNGVSIVRLFVNDMLKEEKSVSVSNNYTFNIPAESEMVGTAKITVQATATTQSAGPGSDTIKLRIGGIVPGENEN